MRELVDGYGGALLVTLIVLVLIAWFGGGRGSTLEVDKGEQAAAPGLKDLLATELEDLRHHSLDTFVEHVLADLWARGNPRLMRGLPSTPGLDGWLLEGDAERWYFLDFNGREIVAVRRGTSRIERNVILGTEAWEWIARLWLRTCPQLPS